MTEDRGTPERNANGNSPTKATRPFVVRVLLPPDPDSPPSHRPYRFPPQGPAIVAAAVARDGIVCQATDLDVDLETRPIPGLATAFDERDRLRQHFQVAPREELVALADEMITRLVDDAPLEEDAVAISIDRHTQILVSLLLGSEIKRRFGLPVILGGANARAAQAEAEELGVLGVDLISTAESPNEIRASFAALRELPRHRWTPPADPGHGALPTPPDDWPVPDFAIYRLERYRRDPFRAEGPSRFSRYDGSIGPSLLLPYHFTWDCQYACTFCTRGGTQSVKSVDRVVRDLATLAERHDCRDFMLFDAQINLVAKDFAEALLAAGLGLQWTDSFRVTPLRPKDVLETMARAGCVGLTFGVESASDRMLKRMVKGHSAAQATHVVADAHRLEMFVRVNLLPCFPGETQEDHEATVRWVEENASCIDEVVPSSFYLASNSPLLGMKERYGIELRGRRRLSGDYKFRKNYGSLAFDEIGGLSWEEREGMLRLAEEDLRQAWARGRAGQSVLTQPSQVFALRRRFATKAECYDRITAWGGDAATPAHLVPPPGAEPTEPVVTPVATQPEIPALSPLCRRAKAQAAVQRLLASRNLKVTTAAALPSQFGLHISGGEGETIDLFVEARRPGRTYFQEGERLGLWYARQETSAPPRWTMLAVKAAARVLLSPAASAIADELAPASDEPMASLPPEKPPAQDESLRRFTVLDLVRLGHKPTASVLVRNAAEGREWARSFPAAALSRFGVTRDSLDNLIFSPAPQEDTPRMLYVGREEAATRRLAEIEEALYVTPDPNPERQIALQVEFGVALGFPACCAEAFARRLQGDRQLGDFYLSVERLGWNGQRVDWRLNHVVARVYELPFLIHVPCQADCVATRQGVDDLLEGLYSKEERAVLESVLSQGVVIFPDDRMALFRPIYGPDAYGIVHLTHLDEPLHPEVLGGPLPPERRLPFAEDGWLRADVDRVRIRAGRLEVAVGRTWHAAVEKPEETRPPLLFVAGRSHGETVVAAEVVWPDVA